MPAKKTPAPARKSVAASRTRTRTAPAPRTNPVLTNPALGGFGGDGEGERTAFLEVRRMALADLNDHPRNSEVRKHPEPGTPKWETLKKSLEHDYFDPIVWNVRNGQLVSGHLRKKVMRAEGLYTHAMVVVVDYDEPTHLARLLAANKGIGNDDPEGQATFLSELKEIGNGFEIDWTGFSTEETDMMISTFFEDDEHLGGEGGEYDGDGGAEGGEEDEAYTTKISAPTYTPKGEAPPLSELIDTSKRDSLIEQIEAAPLSVVPENVKAFLRAGASRHVVFDYGKIADYYAHAPAEIQRLFENSALVIIDFDKAIENGYVLLTERMKEVYALNQERLHAEGNYGADGPPSEDGDEEGEEEDEEEEGGAE